MPFENANVAERTIASIMREEERGDAAELVPGLDERGIDVERWWADGVGRQ